MKAVINSDGGLLPGEAMDGNGAIHSVYEKAINDGNHYAVYYRKRNKKAVWQVERIISKGDFYAETPTVSVSSDGQHIHALWRSRTGDKKNTYLTEAESFDGGTTWQ